MQKDETRRLRTADLKPARGSARTAQCWGGGSAPLLRQGSGPGGSPPPAVRGIPSARRRQGSATPGAGSVSRPTAPCRDPLSRTPRHRARLCPARPGAKRLSNPGNSRGGGLIPIKPLQERSPPATRIPPAAPDPAAHLPPPRGPPVPGRCPPPAVPCRRGGSPRPLLSPARPPLYLQPRGEARPPAPGSWRCGRGAGVRRETPIRGWLATSRSRTRTNPAGADGSEGRAARRASSPGSAAPRTTAPRARRGRGGRGASGAAAAAAGQRRPCAGTGSGSAQPRGTTADPRRWRATTPGGLPGPARLCSARPAPLRSALPAPPRRGGAAAAGSAFPSPAA